MGERVMIFVDGSNLYHSLKAHFNRLFLRFGITSGIKRVKLATLLYRRQLCLQANVTEHVHRAHVSSESSNSLPKALRTGKSQTVSGRPSTSSKTIFASSTISSDCGTGLNWPSGMRRGKASKLPTPKLLHAWSQAVTGVESIGFSAPATGKPRN